MYLRIRGRRPGIVAGGIAACALIALAIPAAATAAPPSNDNWAGRTALPLSGAHPGTNVEATTEAGEPELSIANTHGSSVWYSYTHTPPSGPVTMGLCGDPALDTVIGVFTGAGPVGSLTEFAADDDGCGPIGGPSQVTFNATNGTVYSIMIGGWTSNPGPGDQGTFTLNINQGGPPPPGNDNLAGAEALVEDDPGVFLAEGTNTGATKEAQEPNHGNNAGGHSVWYHWTAQATGSAYAVACGDPNLDTLLGVYLATGFPVTTTVASNDDAVGTACGNGNPTDSLTPVFPVTAGQDYKIAVDGHSGDEGNFLVGLVFNPPPPPNDNFANAELLSGLTDTTGGDNRGATAEANEPDHLAPSGLFPNRSIWYRWTAPQSGQATVSLCDSDPNLDSVLAVYSGAALNALTPIVRNDDNACGSGDLRSRVTFAATAATTYQIAVDSYNRSDAIDLDLALVPTAGGGTPGGGQTTISATCTAAKDAVTAAEAKLKKAKAKLKKAKKGGDAGKIKKAKKAVKKAKQKLADAKEAETAACSAASKPAPSAIAFGR